MSSTPFVCSISFNENLTLPLRIESRWTLIHGYAGLNGFMHFFELRVYDWMVYKQADSLLSLKSTPSLSILISLRNRSPDQVKLHNQKDFQEPR